MRDMNDVVGRADLLMLTFDTLRCDVARTALRQGRTPVLAGLLEGGWEERHTPGSFTFAAHAAFFAGFFPTPATPGRHPRPFALRFHGSLTTTPQTCVLDGASIVEGLRRRGYHTLCIGGVGFFNKLNPLGRVLPALFEESHWSPELGVAERHSTRRQIALAARRLAELPAERRVFLFINLSALHAPHWFYLPGARADSAETQAAALAYVDGELPPLFDALRRRGPGLGFLMADHGDAFGEDGFHGHRLGHPTVWNVPYGEVAWEGTP
jgi:hypothetical protein